MYFGRALLALLLLAHAEEVRAERVAVVTGANRGIGFATVKLLCQAFDGEVVLTARNKARGLNAMQRLRDVGCKPVFYPLDITKWEDVKLFRGFLLKTYGGLDVLVNNAGTRIYPCDNKQSFFTVVKATLHQNLYSTLNIGQILFPILRPHARVVNMGSPCGHLSYLPSESLRRQFADPRLYTSRLLSLFDGYLHSAEQSKAEEKGWGEDPYCMAKMGVTALTFIQHRLLALHRPQDDVVVNCYSPGDVRSKLTKFEGTISPSEAAVHVLRLATLPRNVTSPVGQFVWHDLTVANWTSERPPFWDEVHAVW